MVSGGFSFLYHTSGGGAAGKYWLRGHECATSPAELGRNPECRVGQVMVEWPEADNAWSMDDITCFMVERTSATPSRLTFLSFV